MLRFDIKKNIFIFAFEIFVPIHFMFQRLFGSIFELLWEPTYWHTYPAFKNN